MDLSAGLKHTIEITVTHNDTAKKIRSGSLEVFATPAMIALMENTCADSVQPYLERRYSTVGMKVDVRHIAATPVGMKVIVNSELIDVDNKRLVFKVEAFDEKEKIGQGFHERYIINEERFLNKVNSKVIR